MTDLVEILRAYIPGEPAHEEFTAERIAQAADEIERLRKQLEATEQKWSERYKDQAKECLDWKHQAEALHKQLVTANTALALALPYLDNSDSPGGCNGKHPECGHCRAIAKVRAALTDDLRETK